MYNKSKKNFVSFIGLAVVLILGLGLVSVLQTPKSTQPAEPINPLAASTATTIAENTPDTNVSIGGDGLQPPQTMDEWIKGADIIVQAQVVRVVRDGYSLGYDPITGTHLWRDAPQKQASVPGGPVPTPSPAYPVTDFEIKPETVFRDDGHIASGKPLILSVLGRLNSSDTDQTAMPQIGQTYLFVLAPTPDKQAYAAPGECNVLDVKNSQIHCLGQGRRLLPFMQNVSPSVFLVQVQSATKGK